MNKKLLLYFAGIILLFGVIFFAAQKNNNTAQPLSQNKQLQVVTSFYPLYFFAKEIGGDKANISNLTPASAEPHDYEPTAQDIAKIEKSNLLVLNGGSLESWGNKIEKEMQEKQITIVTAAENLVNREIEEEGKKVKDPHVWLDPVLAKQEVIKIEKGFEKADPAHAEYYQKNMKILEGKLDQLNTDFKNGLQSCQKKDFVTSHAAFGYLAAQYGMNQISISGLSPDQEPSAQQLANVVELVKKNDIKVIFFETLVSPKLSETIARETGTKTMVLDPIEGISDDYRKAGHTYMTVMKDNLTNLQTALQCNK